MRQNIMATETSRRLFLKSTAICVAISSYPSVFNCLGNQKIIPKKDANERINLGLASYTFRYFSLDDTISMTQKLGLKYIALKSYHLPLESKKDEITAAAAKVRAGGLELYGCSVVVLTNENEVNQVFEYAKTAGMGMIVAQPVSDLLDLIERKVKEYNIKLAIHNHGPEDLNFPSPLDTYEKIKKLDQRIGLCIDIGHVRRSGFDPSECIRKVADRLMDIHIKDLNTIQLVSDVCEVGRGQLNIPDILRTLLEINFRGVVAFEYEKDLHDPLAGLAESVGYTRGVLSAI